MDILGPAEDKQRVKLKILILCDFDWKSANTIVDHASSFRLYSRHEIFYVNPVGSRIPQWLNLKHFNVVVLHYSIYILGENYLDYTWREAIRQSAAVKVQFIQDEYRTINAFHERMRELGIQILFTCFPDKEIEKVYPEETLPGVVKVSNLTGYVPEYLEEVPDFMTPRPIDVGYRGRGVGFWWLGELYQEKSFIGKRFLERAEGTGLVCDISWHEKDRIYGADWVRFMKSCRCMLGTESGSSIIDFTGDIEQNVRAYCSAHPEATFDEVQALFFRDREGLIQMNQISPRAFESIACGCCLVLFEGGYSGILKPGVHFIELKKDFSNFLEVLEKIRDREGVEAIARQAYNDVIRSGAYSYRTFIHVFDRTIEKYITVKGTGMPPPFLAGNPDSDAGGGLKNAIHRDVPFHVWILWITIRGIADNLMRMALGIVRAVKRRYLLHPFLRAERKRLLKVHHRID